MIKQTCDRCGVADVPMQKFGLVKQKDYCESCGEAYKLYLERLDKLQEKLSFEWEIQSQLLEEEFNA